MHNCFLQISAVNQTAILYDDKWSSEWLHLFLLIILSLISYSNLIKYKILCIHTLSLPLHTVGSPNSLSQSHQQLQQL